MRARLDHLVITAPTLESGVTWVQDRLGVTMPPGGAHPRMGTHNHLMRLGPTSFCEIIAIDPAAPSPGRPRWFGLDQPGPPRLATWLVAVPDLDAAIAACPIDTGRPQTVTRGALTWRLTIPDDGGLIEGGTMPGLIEWPDPHPAAAMADCGYTLVRLDLGHPEPARLRAALDAIGLGDPAIVVQAAQDTTLSAELSLTNGMAGRPLMSCFGRHRTG